jgi:hypothetical protein
MAMLSGNGNMSSARTVGVDGGHEQSTPLCISKGTTVAYRRNNLLVHPGPSVSTSVPVLGSAYTPFWDAATISEYDVLVFNRGE